MAKRPDAVVNKIQFDSSEVDMALRKQIPEKVSVQGNVTCTEPAYIMSVETQRYICLDCGFVFEKLDESDLKRYKEA